jgi:hypothetical protein
VAGSTSWLQSDVTIGLAMLSHLAFGRTSSRMDDTIKGVVAMAG